MSVLKALSLLTVLVFTSACSNLNESSSRTADNANQALKPAVETIQETPKTTSNVLDNASDIIKAPLGKGKKDKEKERQ